MIKRKVAKHLIALRKILRNGSNLVHRGLKPIIDHKRQLSIAFIVSTTLLITNYIVDSFPVPIGGEVTVAQWMEKIRNVFSDVTDNVPDSVCLINVAYDKSLIDYEAKCTASKKDTARQYAGHITTTDRKKLLQFLSIADSLKNYKYILLDVRFEADIPTDATTDSLFDLLREMDNVVFAIHKGSDTSPDAPLEKSGYGDYYTTFLVSDIVKYPIIQKDNGQTNYSIPTKLYSELYNHKFSNFGPFTFDNGHLCKSSIYPTFPIRLTSWMVDSDNTNLLTPQYYYLGADILDTYDPSLVIAPLIQDKVVVIGDFNEDLHDAYIGQQPGALVNLNTYVALCNGTHLVNWLETLITFFVFFVISWLIIRQRQILQYIPFVRKSRSRFIKFIVTFIGFSVILTVYAIIIYFVFDTVFSVVYPSLYFTILELCRKSLK